LLIRHCQQRSKEQYEHAYKEEQLPGRHEGKKSGESEGNTKGILRLEEVA